MLKIPTKTAKFEIKFVGSTVVNVDNQKEVKACLSLIISEIIVVFDKHAHSEIDEKSRTTTISVTKTTSTTTTTTTTTSTTTNFKDVDQIIGVITQFGSTLFEELGETRSVGIANKLWLNTFHDQDYSYLPFTKNMTLHNLFENMYRNGQKRHLITLPNNSCSDDFQFQSIIQLKTPINTIGVKLQLSERTKEWIDDHKRTYLDILDIYRLKVKQIRLAPYLMDIYTQDKLELPRRAPYIVSCQTHLFDYFEISCEPPKSFFKGKSNS